MLHNNIANFLQFGKYFYFLGHSIDLFAFWTK